MAELTDKEAEKLFQQASNALRSNDSLELSKVMETEASKEEAPVEEKPVETPQEEEKPVETPNEEEEQSPSEKTEKDEEKNKEEEQKPEPTELDKLREQLEKVLKENHSLRSQAGRVPHVQRRLQELDKKLEEFEKKRTSPSSQPSAKIQPKVAKLLEGIKETDADLADAIAAAIAEATDGINEEVQTAQHENLKLLREGELTAYRQAEAHRLLEMYPNAAEVFSSPSWSEWKKAQPTGILHLAESDNADEVDYAFKKYASDMLAKYPDLNKTEDSKAPEAAAPKEESEEAKKVEAERQRKKQTAVVAGTPNAPGKVGLPDDPDALFKKYSEEIRKQRTG